MSSLVILKLFSEVRLYSAVGTSPWVPFYFPFIFLLFLGGTLGNFHRALWRWTSDLMTYPWGRFNCEVSDKKPVLHCSNDCTTMDTQRNGLIACAFWSQIHLGLNIYIRLNVYISIFTYFKFFAKSRSR